MIEKDYNVCFVGDYFSMNVCLQNVDTDDVENIEALAANVIQYQYGWDVAKAATIAIEVEGA